jgi:hypothetical protein
MTMTVPTAVVDALSSLLEAELGSIFRFMGEGSPYLSRATAEVRRPLAEMVAAGQRRAGELAELIQSLGGTVDPRPSIQSEEQYLAFLSLKFLLPKLVGAKKLTIDRYQNALSAIDDSEPGARDLLAAHLQELRQELAALETAAAHVARAGS